MSFIFSKFYSLFRTAFFIYVFGLYWMSYLFEDVICGLYGLERSVIRRLSGKHVMILRHGVSGSLISPAQVAASAVSYFSLSKLSSQVNSPLHRWEISYWETCYWSRKSWGFLWVKLRGWASLWLGLYTTSLEVMFGFLLSMIQAWEDGLHWALGFTGHLSVERLDFIPIRQARGWVSLWPGFTLHLRQSLFSRETKLGPWFKQLWKVWK